MQITKTKKGFTLRDSGLILQFTTYEYSSIDDVYLYKNGVLVAIYKNSGKFKEQIIVSAKGTTTTS